MHSYNPLVISDTIAVMVQKLLLEALNKFCWLNSTWYKEIWNDTGRMSKNQISDLQINWPILSDFWRFFGVKSKCRFLCQKSACRFVNHIMPIFKSEMPKFKSEMPNSN